MKAAKAIERVMNAVFTVCGFVTLAFVLFITVFLLISGLPAIGKIGVFRFLFGTVWKPTAESPLYGILPFLLTSVYGMLGAILLGVPLGVLCAVHLAKMLPKRVSDIFSAAVELLSGIPSVVYGLVGMILIVPLVRSVFSLPDGANLFSAILVLTVMILPTVISVSKTAIEAVPAEYEEGSLALGATKTETVFKVVVPAAKSGILSSIVLGMGSRRGDGGHDGFGQRSEYARNLQKRAVFNHGGCLRNVLFLRLAPSGAVFRCAGAVPLYPPHQSRAERGKKEKKVTLCKITDSSSENGRIFCATR